ncbi:MAG TPA: DUF6252 family protein [Luteibaculaceae bacterium]|nr:DUF6252 family protein [Luteibaculaceae bacterium]
MFNNRLFTGCVIVLGMMVASCEKPATPVEPTPVQRAAMHATIENQNWDAAFAVADDLNEGFTISGAVNGKLLTLFIPSSDLRTHKVNNSTAAFATYVDSTDKEVIRYDSKVDALQYAGEITLTKYDPIQSTLSGKFKLILRNTETDALLAVDEGSFTDIEVGAIPGTPYFTALFFKGNQTGIGTVYRSNLTGRIEVDSITSAGLLPLDNRWVVSNASQDRFLVLGKTSNNRRVYKYLPADTGIPIFETTYPDYLRDLTTLCESDGSYYTTSLIPDSGYFVRQLIPETGALNIWLGPAALSPKYLVGKNGLFYTLNAQGSFVSAANFTNYTLSNGFEYAGLAMGENNMFYTLRRSLTNPDLVDLIRFSIVGSSLSTTVVKSNIDNTISSIDSFQILLIENGSKMLIVNPDPGGVRTIFYTVTLNTGVVKREFISLFVNGYSPN